MCMLLKYFHFGTFRAGQELSCTLGKSAGESRENREANRTTPSEPRQRRWKRLFSATCILVDHITSQWTHSKPALHTYTTELLFFIKHPVLMLYIILRLYSKNFKYNSKIRI